MLKLSKYELRKNRSALLIILAGLAALELCFLFCVWRDAEDYVFMWSGFLVLYAVICYFSVFLFAITNYYREINSKTSYLVFMTPVSSLWVILSKMLTVLMLGVILAGALGALAFLDLSLLLDYYQEYESLGEVINEALARFGINTSEIAAQLLFGIITFLLSVFSIVALLYLCITLAATLLQNSRLKLVVTIAFFIAGFWLRGKLQELVGELYPVVYTESTGFTQLLYQSWPYALLNLAVLALCMALTTWLLDKKLSL